MTDTRYSVALADKLCRRISEGTPLRQAVREIEGAPPEATVRGWVRDNREGFAAKYESARRLQADAWADELVLLANRDDLDSQDKRVRIDTLKWLCSKILPRRYGERLLMAGDPDNPIQHLHRAVAPTLADLPLDALDALEAFCSRMVMEHEPAGATLQHDAVERSAPALLEQRQP